MKLEISLFKFDKNSDYLPYYTKHFLKIENEKNILDILNTINKSAKLGFTDSADFDLVINGVYVKASITLEEVVKNFGKDLTIEPISIRRAYDDLLIDDNDFKEKIKILKDLVQPEDKIEYIKKIKKSGYDVAMIGDGVNDAASLALADVSFAMGAIGSDASIEAADFALMHDDLRRVPESIFLSKEVLRIVKQNFVIWAITNSTGLFLVFFGVLGPVGASAYNFITDFFPILNVFKIYGLKINRHTYDDEYKKEIKYSAGHLKIT